MKIAVSGERLGRALPSTLNISINYFRPVSVNMTKKKRSLRNEKLRVNRASETEEQRKERLRIEEKTRK